MGMCAVAGKKTMRHYADGGEIDPEMQKQIEANKAKFNPPPKQGFFSGLLGGSEPKPQAAPPAQPATGMVGAIKNRNDELKKVSAYKNGGKIKGPGTPTSDSIPAEVKQTGEPIKVSTGERVVSAEQDALLQGVAKKMGFESLDAMLEAGTGKPVGPTMKGGMAHAGSGAKPKEEGWGEGYGGKLTAADIVGTLNDNGLLGAEGVPHPSLALQSGSPAAQVAQTPPAVVPVAPPATSSPAPASLVQAALHQQGPAQNANLDQGLNTQVNAGVIRQGNSFTGTGPNVKEDMSKPLTSINMKANNEGMAKANAIQQEMIDSQAGYRAEPGSSGGRIADSGRAEGDALLAKWGRETDAKNAMQMAAANPKASQAIASTYGSNVQGETALARDATEQLRNETNNATLRRGQDTRLQEAGMQGDVTMRGQDVTAKTAANTLAGNPVTNDLTRAQTGMAQAALDDKKRLSALADAIQNEPEGPKRQAYIANYKTLTGKMDKYSHATGSQSIDPATGLVIKSGDTIYNESTGQQVGVGQQQPSAQQAAPSGVKVPAGHTYAGTAGGKPVFRDAKGNLVQEGGK